MDNDTIRMFINEEEIVSNKEFTINEEILSSSSTIINNCYPKSWELTRDYTNQFYFPKDYSKFILGKGNYKYGTEEFTIFDTPTENSVTYETNVEKEWNDLQVFGDTTQDTRSGKNLFNLDAFLSVAQRNNCTTETIENGFIINFTAGADAIVGGTYANGTTLPSSVRSGVVKVEPNTTYTISLSSSPKAYISFFNSSYVATQGYTKLPVTYETSTYTFTTNATTVYLYLRLGIQDNSYTSWTYQNIQIEKGSTATSYEVYGKMPSLEFPSPLESVGVKNLLQLTDGGYSSNGVIASVNNNVITLNGKAEGATSFILIPSNLTELNGVYTLSANNDETKGSPTLVEPFADIRIRVDDSNQMRVLLGEKNNYNTGNLTMSSPVIRIRTAVGLSYDNFVIKPVLTQDGIKHKFFTDYGVEVVNINKNVFDGEFSAGSIYPNGTINPQNASFSIVSTNLIPVQPSTTYVFSNDENYVIDRIAYFNRKGVIISRSNSLLVSQFTTPDNCYYIRFNINSQGITPNLINNAMIRNINSNSEYESQLRNSEVYNLTNPLRKVDDVSDRLYFEGENAFVERKIGYIVLNGTESWTHDTTGQRYWRTLDNVVVPANTSTKGKAMSNIEVLTANQTIYTTGMSGIAIHPLGRIYISDDVYNNLSTTNVELQYIYVVPTIENLGISKKPSSYDSFNTAYLINNKSIGKINIKYFWKNYDVLFAGVVKNSGNISLNPREPHYCSLQILDYKTFLSESDTLDFVIDDKTIIQAINMVIEAVSGYGFVLGNINIENGNDKISAYSTLNKTAYDVFQYLAEISGAKWRARYIDNSTMAIDFYDASLLPEASSIEYTKEYWETNNIVDMKFNFSTRDYRNKQIVLSNEVYGSIDFTEVILSNGYENNYLSQNNIAKISSIMVNGVEMDVATQEEKSIGIDADFYYTPGKNIIESAITYTAGTQIVIVYTPLVKGRQISYNTEETARIASQTNTLGIISRYETRNDILSNDELKQIGETYIQYKGKPEVILTIKTFNENLYNIGEVVYFDAPLDDLKQKYMVKTKKTDYIINGEQINLFYTFELTSSYNSEKAINYFDNQRNKSQGNIQEGESITRNIDINSSANIIWRELFIQEIPITADGDNILNSILNSPFID